MKKPFRIFAAMISNAAGDPRTFLLALLVVLTWAVTGPLFDFSNTWQLVINTGTTIVTFLMVFLIQNTQNRDGKAMQLKLDELIRATTARNSFIDLEDLSDEDLSIISKEFDRIALGTTHPAIATMHAKLAAAHHHRKHDKPQGIVEQATHVAGQVAHMIGHTLTEPIGESHSGDKAAPHKDEK